MFVDEMYFSEELHLAHWESGLSAARIQEALSCN